MKKKLEVSRERERGEEKRREKSKEGMMSCQACLSLTAAKQRPHRGEKIRKMNRYTYLTTD